VERPIPGVFKETTVLSQGILEIKGAMSCNLELPAILTIDEVFVTKGAPIAVGDNIIRFNTADIKKQITVLKKQSESAEIALMDFIQSFNLRVKTLRKLLSDGTNQSEINIVNESGGLVTSIDVKKGDRVIPGMKLCEVADDSKFLVRTPFSTAFDIKTGMKAEISVPSNMTTFSGTVKDIGGQITINGAKARMVTVEIVNPGVIVSGSGVNTVIEGGITPMADGELDYINTKSIYAEVSGYITSIDVNLYESVPIGKTLMKIDIPETDSAKEELDYMLSTGIYNGRTEKQLRDSLEEANASLERLEVFAETGLVTAESNGIISDMPVQKGMKFAGGTLYEYAPDGSNYQVVLKAGNMTAVKAGQECTIYYYIDGRQTKVSGKVTDVSAGSVTVESLLIGSKAAQAQSFSAEVILSEYSAFLTLPLSAMVGANSVYVVTNKSSVLGDQSVVSRREVTTGHEDEHRVEIIGGILKEDIVIVAWDRALSDGAVVDIVSGK